MSKILSTASHHKRLLKLSVAALLGFMGQSALAACPDTAGIGITNTKVGNFNNENIYFCKQNFSADTLVFSPSETELLSGGSQVISKGNTSQSFPLSNSANLMGFNVNNLALNQLSAYFPNEDGDFGSPSLFNFYIRAGRRDNCTSQYSTIRSFLRNNPNTFRLNTSFATIAADTSSSTSLVKITGAKLKSAIDPTKELTATIDFYHANPTSGQFFTDNSFFNGYRDCWFEVGTKVTITPNSGSLKFAGDYNLEVSVNTL